MSSTATSVAILRAAYPRQEFPDESVRLYVGMLADLDEGAVEQAVKRLIRRSTWLPSVAEIREEVAEETLSLPTVAEALLSIDSAARERHALVHECFAAVGGRYAYDHSERPDMFRREFRVMYESRRAQALREEAGAEGRSLAGELRTRAEIMAGRTLEALPETDRMPPRPVWARWLRRNALGSAGLPFPVTDEEKHDAIKVLATLDGGGPLHTEAQKIMDEASA